MTPEFFEENRESPSASDSISAEVFDLRDFDESIPSTKDTVSSRALIVLNGGRDIAIMRRLAEVLGMAHMPNKQMYEYLRSLRKGYELRGVIEALITRVIFELNPPLAIHGLHVSSLATKVAEILGLSSHAKFVAGMGGILHDIGKLGIPPGITEKPFAHTHNERVRMKEHPFQGYLLASGLGLPSAIAGRILNHHERANGRGYPQATRNVSVLDQAIAVSDVVDAMASNRPHHAPSTKDEIISTLKLAGYQKMFNSQVVEAILSVLEGFDLSAFASGNGNGNGKH